MNVQLHIEELVLHGFAGVDRHQIGERVQQELTRLFAERGVPPGMATGGNVARIDGGSFTVAPNPKPDQIGTQVAQAIYNGVAK
jgi:hypothetical protein